MAGLATTITVEDERWVCIWRFPDAFDPKFDAMANVLGEPDEMIQKQEQASG
jgi:hypothetical protein